MVMAYYGTQFEDIPRTWNECYFFVLCGSLGWGVALYPKTDVVRFTVLIGFISGVVFATTLNSFIMTAMASPFLKDQVSSILEITNGDFKLVGDRYAFVQMSQQNQVIPRWPLFLVMCF